jgi:hypothetical protein
MAVWTEHKTKDGRSYYYNKDTKESVWDRPEGFVPALEEANAAKHKAAQWEERLDKKSMRLYYYDRTSKTSQWIKPVGDVPIISFVDKDKLRGEDKKNVQLREQDSTTTTSDEVDKNEDEKSHSHATKEVETTANQSMSSCTTLRLVKAPPVKKDDGHDDGGGGNVRENYHDLRHTDTVKTAEGQNSIDNNNTSRSRNRSYNSPSKRKQHKLEEQEAAAAAAAASDGVPAVTTPATTEDEAKVISAKKRKKREKHASSKQKYKWKQPKRASDKPSLIIHDDIHDDHHSCLADATAPLLNEEAAVLYQVRHGVKNMISICIYIYILSRCSEKVIRSWNWTF